jgi:NADH-quinone oxidoreductase subunit L
MVAHHANMVSDPLTAMMLMIILVLTVPGQIFLMMYLKRSDEPPYFYALICLFIFAAMAACLANTLLALMALAYVAAIVGSVILAGLTRPGHNSMAWRSLAMISTGMACFLIAVALLISRTGLTGDELFNATGLSVIGPHLQAALGVESYVQILHFRSGPSAAGLNFLTWSGVGFVLFGLALAGQFPFQACPLDTLESPAPLNALLTGAILPLLGIYIVGRLYPFFTLDTRLIMAIAGCTTLSTALLSAWVQTDIKHMTWWIISGQYGWCFLLFGSGAWVQAMEHAILWATLALGLFSTGGVVLACTGGRGDVRTLGGLWKKLPVTAGAALVFVVIGSQVMNVMIPGELPHELLWLHHYGRGLEGFGRLLYWVPLAAVGVLVLNKPRAAKGPESRLKERES